MRTSYVLAILCLLFATCCDGLQTEKQANQENDKFEVNIVDHEVTRHLRSMENEALDHGKTASKKHETEQRELTDTTKRASEERGFSLSKITNSFSTSSTQSTKNFATDSVEAAKKTPSLFQKSPSFGKLNGLLNKNPSDIAKDVEKLQKSPSYKNLETTMGKDPMTASTKELKRAETYVWKNRGKRGMKAVGNVLGYIMAFGVIGGIVGTPVWVLLAAKNSAKDK